MQVPNLVQEVVIQTTPKKKKWIKAKWLSEDALQVAEENREVKGKGENERYTYLNAEFQRRARKGKKAFVRINLKNIQATPEAQLQKNKWPNQKMGQRTK